MPIGCKQPLIPLFGRKPRHSSVPASFPFAAARSVGQGRPSGRRGRALPWTDASTVALSIRAGTVVRMVAPVVLMAMVCTVPTVAVAQSSARSLRRACRMPCERGR